MESGLEQDEIGNVRERRAVIQVPGSDRCAINIIRGWRVRRLFGRVLACLAVRPEVSAKTK